jgi:hypothetical protein
VEGGEGVVLHAHCVGIGDGPGRRFTQRAMPAAPAGTS